MGERRGASFCWENLMEGDHLEDLGTDGTIILNWIIKVWGGVRVD